MAEHPNPSGGRPLDPYAPEVVRKMAVVALVCALAGLGLAAFFGISGFLGNEEFAEKTRNGQPIVTPWLYAWLLQTFGPIGVLVFDELAAVIFLGLSVFGVRQWWAMRTGNYDPKQDKASLGLFLTIAVVAAIGLATFFAVVRIVVALR